MEEQEEGLWPIQTGFDQLRRAGLKDVSALSEWVPGEEVAAFVGSLGLNIARAVLSTPGLWLPES